VHANAVHTDAVLTNCFRSTAVRAQIDAEHENAVYSTAVVD